MAKNDDHNPKKPDEAGQDLADGSSNDQLEKQPEKDLTDTYTEKQERKKSKKREKKRDNPSAAAEDEDSDSAQDGEKKKYPHSLMGWYYYLANLFYDYLYFVGIQFMRSMARRGRRVVRSVYLVRGGFAQRSERWRRNFRIWRKERWWAFTTPLRELDKRYKEFRKELFNARHYRAKTKIIAVYLRIAGLFFKAIWHALKFALNYIAPIVGVLIFVGVVNLFNSFTYALHVEYNGEEMGYIADEAVFNQAEIAVRERINQETYISPEDNIPKFEMRIIDSSLLVSVDDLTNKLIQASGNELQEAYGLYVEDKFVSAIEDGNSLLLYLNSMLMQYEHPESGEEVEAQFMKNISLKPGLYPVSSVQPLDEIKQKLSGEEKAQREYTVVSGDDGLRIAQKNGITFDELKRLNPDVDVSLYPGDTLLISKSVPFLEIRVKKLIREEESIAFRIVQEPNPNLDRGVVSTKQAGVLGVREITREVVMIDGIEVESSILNTRVVKEPQEQILIVGGKTPMITIPDVIDAPLRPGAFMWPTTVSARINPGFLGYYGHTGSDISWGGCYGSPILASMEGVVTVAGWSGAYGYCVVIDHGNGFQTLYAHCSSLNVSVGDYVEQGNIIAAIGSTGNSTGPHLHFEVRVNGKPVDAAPYLYG